MNKGYIYIMTNPSFKEYVKIGWAANVEQRKRELDFRAGRKAPSDHWVDLGCGVSAGHISLTINGADFVKQSTFKSCFSLH